MDPKRPSSGVLLAPPPSGASAALRLPAAGEPPPPIDLHIVQPETREEMVRGRRIIAQPALPPHGDRHFGLDYVIGAHVKEGYVGSTDLLTRTGHQSDFATDTCVRRSGVDPSTGGRYLEELAFELVNEQSMRDVTERAQELTARGVRRVVAIFVKTAEAREWSAAKSEWKRLDPEGIFSDPTLTHPLRVKELVNAADADNAVARALVAKKNPVVAEKIAESEKKGREKGRAEGEEKGRAEGEEKGRAEGVLLGRRREVETACKLLAIELSAEKRSWIQRLDLEGLDALLASLINDRRLP